MSVDSKAGLLQGAKWELAAKLYGRTIGLANTLILLTLLKPDDFGIAALATFYVSLFLALSNVGVTHFVVGSTSEMSEEELNSIWSLGLVVKLFSSFCLFLSSDAISYYVNNESMSDVIKAVSLLPIISGLRNVGLDLEEKKYNFKLLVINNMISKTVGTFISVFLAIQYESYWALIIGMIVISAIETILGYKNCSYRPKLSCKYWRDQWCFSKWLYMSSVFGFLRSRIDILVLGNISTTKSVGMYSISTEFSWLAYTEVIWPMNRGFYAVLSKSKLCIESFRTLIVKQYALNLMLVIPCAFGMAAISEPFTALILGDDWVGADKVISNVAGLMVVMCFYGLLCIIMTVQKKLKYIVASDFLVIVTIISTFYFMKGENIVELSYVRFLIGLLFLFWLFALILKFTTLTLSDLIYLFIVPTVSSVVMFMSVDVVRDIWESNLISLLSSVSVGMIVYCISYIVLSYLLRYKFNFYWDIACYIYEQASVRIKFSFS